MPPDSEATELEALRRELAALRSEKAQLAAENAKLTALLDALSEVVVLVSIDDRLLHVNAAARQEFVAMMGDKTADPIGKTSRELGIPAVVSEYGEAIFSELQRTGTTVAREFLFPTSTGSRWREDRANPVRGKDGEIWGTAIVSRDVHERKLAEEFRIQMIGVLGHDLRNPLSAISALAALCLRGTAQPDRLAPRLEQIEHAATRALEMIKSLLLFSEGRFHGFAVAPVPSDLRALSRAAINEVTAANGGRAIELFAEGDCTCDCDPARIGQVLANLLSNALAHGAADSPVQLAVAATPATLEIRVTNQGPAISPELMGHLFEPFHRGPDSASRALPPGSEGRARGLGLGLYIVREIVQAHRGSVTVTSTERDGTCFTVVLPRASP